MDLRCPPPRVPASQFCIDGRYRIRRRLIVRSIVSQSLLPRNSLIGGTRRPCKRLRGCRRYNRKMWSRLKRHRSCRLLEWHHQASGITRRQMSLVRLQQSGGHGRGGDHNVLLHRRSRLWDPGCLGSSQHASMLGALQELVPYPSVHIGLIRRCTDAKLPPRNFYHCLQYLLRPWGIIPEIQLLRRGLLCQPCFLGDPNLLLILNEGPWGKFCPTVDTQRCTMLTCRAEIHILALGR